MVDIITHTSGVESKGSALTVEEMDQNLINLNNSLNQLDDYISGLITSVAVEPDWVKPSDWLSLDEFDTSLEKVQMLYAIYPSEGNYVEFTYTVVGGYTVDWGDGVVENFNSAVQAEHQYDFTDIDLNGTLTSDGFKQAIITITPQVPGNKFTKIEPSGLHSEAGSYHKVNALLLNISSNGATEFINPAYWVSADADLRFVKELNLSLTALTDANSLLYNFTDLVNLVTFNIPAATTVEYCFNGCESLRKLPSIDLTSATNCNNFLDGAYNLRYVTQINAPEALTCRYMAAYLYQATFINITGTSKATDMYSMFRGCEALKSIDTLDTTSAINLEYLFDNCQKLLEAPTMNTSNVTSTRNMFSLCLSLHTVGWMDLSNVTTAYQMFQSCEKLLSVPGYDLSSCTDVRNMFAYCNSFVDFPVIDFSNATQVYALFGWTEYKTYPIYDFSAASDAADFAYNSNRFIRLPAIDFEGSTVPTGNWWKNSGRYLHWSDALNVDFTHSYQSCRLSAAALNHIFTNLATVTAKTITVFDNPGTGQAGYDPTIATAKGWTVAD